MVKEVELIKIRLNKITVDLRIESLIAPFQNKVRGYHHIPVTNYDELPNILVFNSGKKIYLVDGWDRYVIARNSEKEEVESEVIFGSLREAIQFSLSRADQIYPRIRTVPRSKYVPDTFHRYIKACINDPKWGQLSDRWIARMCGVSLGLVNKLHQEIIEEMYREVTEEELVQ